MKPLILLDMDGVLADLEGGMNETFNINILEVERRELFGVYLPDYVRLDGFAKQEPLKNAKILVDYLTKLRNMKDIDLSIMTSAGVFFNPISEVTTQKKVFLEKNFPELGLIPFCATTSGQDKSIFASPRSILIDDHLKNIRHFEQAGGVGLHYVDSQIVECLEVLDEEIARIKLL